MRAHSNTGKRSRRVRVPAFSYTYNPLGKLTSETYPSNLASLGSNSSPSTVASVFSYDGESRMTGANVADTGVGDITLTPTAGESAYAQRLLAQGGKRAVEFFDEL